MKKILAFLLAASMLFAFAACGEDTTTDETTTTTAADVAEEITDAVDPAQTDAAPADATTAVDTSAESTEAASAADESTTAAETTVPAAAPATTEEIITYYNTAINKAYNAKVGFNKERYTDNEVLDTSGALTALKSVVYSFMGIGAENKYTKDVTKGQWESDLPHHYLRKSTLSASDVTAAKCTESNGKYTIVLNVKGGSSKASETEKYNNSPIDKCGICIGDGDKSYFDHKTAVVIYSAISEMYPSAVLEEQYSNAVVKAVIDSATGNLVSLTVEYDIACQMDVGIIGKGDATGTTHILYKNFKY